MIEVFELLQLPLVELIIDKLRYNGEDLNDWLDEKEGDTEDINLLAYQLVRKLRPYIMTAIQRNTELSYEEISQHIEDNWGAGDEIAIDYATEEETIEFINAFIILALLNTSWSESPIIHQYRDVIQEIRDLQPRDNVQSEIDRIILGRYDKGLDSGYTDDGGTRWALDRYVMNSQARQALDIYEMVLVEELSRRNVELVQIPRYSDPRPACRGLQAGSGIICVVPRNQASEESQYYPNIYDAEHLYGYPEGHHGINCRHTWTAIGGSSRNLYRRIDRENEVFRYNRKARNQRLQDILRR